MVRSNPRSCGHPAGVIVSRNSASAAHGERYAVVLRTLGRVFPYVSSIARLWYLGRGVGTLGRGHVITKSDATRTIPRH
jgi:hypothetical protein